MTRIKSIRADVTAQLTFGTPMFDLRSMSERFFEGVYKTIGPKYNITTRDLSVANTNVIGDFWARFSLFGGSNTVTIFPDRLVVQFGNLTPPDYLIANEVTRLGHDTFVSAFPEVEVSQIDYRTLEHFELIGASSSADFFEKFSTLALQQGVLQAWPGVFEPGIKFKHTSADQKSVVTCLGERSVVSASAVFLAVTVLIQDAASLPTFDEKYQRLARLLERCLNALHLDLVTD